MGIPCHYAGVGSMDNALIGLIATIIGAIIGAILNEAYKRHRDSVATAAALAGELSSYLQAFVALDDSLPVLIDRVEHGGPLNIPEQAPATDVAFEAYVDKIGLLGSQLAEQVAYVYGQVRGFRSAFFPLTRRGEKFDAPYATAALRVAHMFSQNANRHAQPLITALQERANRSFWLFWRHWLS